MSFGVHVDLTITSSEETRFVNKYMKFIRRISREYNCSAQEIVPLVLIYYKFQCESKNTKGMTKMQFKEFLHNTLDLTDGALLEYVAWSLDTPKNTTHIFPMECWVRAILLFVRGTYEEKIEHCYKIYDRFQEGKITRSNMTSLMQHALIVDDLDEDSVRDLVDLMTKRMDLDGDGIVSKEDFKKYVRRDPLTLETFGQCLPNREALRAFLSTVYARVGNVK